MPKITFKICDGTSRTVVADIGATVMGVAQTNGINIEGVCEGSMACSTCHVIVDSSWFFKLEPASEEEEDLLDLTLGLTACSRLGCQIVMTESLDGIIVTLPTNTNNIIGI